MMIVVVVIFAVCWFPQHFFFFLVTGQHPELMLTLGVQHVYLMIYWLATSTSMYNPIIYCYMNNKYVLVRVWSVGLI